MNFGHATSRGSLTCVLKSEIKANSEVGNEGIGASLQTYQMRVHFEAALDQCSLMAPYDPRYSQVGLNLISVQVCAG